MRKHKICEHKIRPRGILTILFVLCVFCIIVITMVIAGIIVYIFIEAGLLGEIETHHAELPVIALGSTSILIGTFVAVIISHVPLRPINTLINGMNRLASGDYKARIHIGGLNINRELSKSFNTLALELQNTEMLRSDFVNNFSHEFKTPIVSIRGFAKLLAKGNLTIDQQKDYINIIVDESTRLSDLATNVLNLTKVENQSILTEITQYNLSEQVRNCILLLEKKWSNKNLTIKADFGECTIDANEELLKQVWINLIDNSIKFSPEGGQIGFSIKETHDYILVSISNNGPEIREEDIKRIYDKFWQGDKSHSIEGTGIGLSIARRITELHKGSITVMSCQKETIFTVNLPKVQ